MLHAVPSELARNKELAQIYERHWNPHVSPGEAVYAHRGSGEELLNRAKRQRRMPLAPVHEKEVFL